MYNRERQVEHLYEIMQRPPIMSPMTPSYLVTGGEGPWFIDYYSANPGMTKALTR